MQWNPDLPQSAVFVDVDTTGLSSADRVVALGAISLSLANVGAGPLPVSYIHLVFNPERRSHPYAERIHGYSPAQLVGQACVPAGPGEEAAHDQHRRRQRRDIHLAPGGR